MPGNLPTAVGLLEAIREHLDVELRPKLSGKDAYDIRVAANLLAILKRELESGPGVADRERSRLVELLDSDASLDDLNSELSDRIRNRQINPTSKGLLTHLRQTALDKLGIDNPAYSAYIRARNDV